MYNNNFDNLKGYLIRIFGATIKDAENSAHDALCKAGENYDQSQEESKISMRLKEIVRNEYSMLLKQRG